MTDYLALLLEEQRKEEQERAETGTWETGAVRVPRLRREEEQEENWESSGEALLSETARQLVRAAAETEAAASGMEQSDGLEWTARRWAAGETEVVQAGLRSTEQAEPLPLARQVEKPVLPVGIAGTAEVERERIPGTAGAERVRISGAAGVEWESIPRIVETETERVLETVGAERESVSGTAANGAGWLDQAVRVSLGGLPAPDRESRVVTLEPAEWSSGVGRLELRQLDRLVRRDARRFDGGFQLL